MLKGRSWCISKGIDQYEDGKMKKIVWLSAGVLALFFMGCAGSTAVSPGGVLSSPGGTAENQKVITFHVVGKGLEPENALTKGEAVLMAERAAVADGYRQLAEKISGVYVDAFMKAGRGSVNQEQIQIHTQTWLRGTEIMEFGREEYGITSARMQLRIYFSKQGMVWWPMGIGQNLKPAGRSFWSALDG